jgi:hydroxyacylglutathione hydrolase
MLEILTFVLGPLDTNCYLLWDESSTKRSAWVVDPADAGDFLSDQILEHQLNLESIILTHGHVDHLMGSTELALNFNLPLMVHQQDLFLVNRSVATAKHWFGSSILPPPPTKTFDSKVLSLGSYDFSVIHTPGHTPGSVVLHCNKCIFETRTSIALVGDLIFEKGFGRTDFSYASSNQLHKSIQKLNDLVPQATLMLPGHGSPFSWKSRSDIDDSDVNDFNSQSIKF